MSPATRREFLVGSAASALTLPGATVSAAEEPAGKRVLTPANQFQDVSRGTPVPHTLRGDALHSARLTPESWRLEIVGDGGAKVPKPLTIENGLALDFRQLQRLGEARGIRFIKAVQCLNIEYPLGQGLWEGVPLRDIVRLTGAFSNVRRVSYSGYHNNAPSQIFQSSLNLSDVLEAPPGNLPPLVVYRLNGQPIPLERGGPVRMLIPWAHGFKSIKWLQQIVLTNEFRANDTYADANNDPESHLKTAAYMDESPTRFANSQDITLTGAVISGVSGLSKVEYWLRKVGPQSEKVSYTSKEWQEAPWMRCTVDAQPPDWHSQLPSDTPPATIWGIDPNTLRANEWPMRYTMAGWVAVLGRLPRGTYEFRARAVDRNGCAQPEPRPDRQTGLNPVQEHRFDVTA